MKPITENAPDIVTEAQKFLGVPYLWGGNSALGIDCSGLVQVACSACGIAAPADSDLQRAACPRSNRSDAAAGGVAGVR